MVLSDRIMIKSGIVTSFNPDVAKLQGQTHNHNITQTLHIRAPFGEGEGRNSKKCLKLKTFSNIAKISFFDWGGGRSY